MRSLILTFHPSLQGKIQTIPEAEKLFNADLQEGLLDVLCLNQEDVFKKIRKLHINKAPGVDGLVSNLFIETATNISLPLSATYRSSLDSGSTSRRWKRANVCVICKKGARNECGNYRHVSLTFQACKIFESIKKMRFVKIYKNSISLDKLNMVS